MPCPLFEPQRRVIQATDAQSRLPLLYEFEGVCHAGENGITPIHRFHYCNRGNARGYCESFPATMPLTAVRFNVTGRTPAVLTVLVMEEENHWPRIWSTFEFGIADGHLQPEIEDTCRRAQLFHFCRGYLERF